MIRIGVRTKKNLVKDMNNKIIHIIEKYDNIRIRTSEYWISGSEVRSIEKQTIPSEERCSVVIYLKNNEVLSMKDVSLFEVVDAEQIVDRMSDKPSISIPSWYNDKVYYPLFNKRVEDCGFSKRLSNILLANGFSTIKDVCKMRKTDFLRFRNSGKKTLAELNEYLKEHNLQFNMDVENIEKYHQEIIKQKK